MGRLKWWFYWKVLLKLLNEDLLKNDRAKIFDLVRVTHNKYLYN